MIATGARPSINLAGPLQVDAWGVQAQVQACRSMGVQRVVTCPRRRLVAGRQCRAQFTARSLLGLHGARAPSPAILVFMRDSAQL